MMLNPQDEFADDHSPSHLPDPPEKTDVSCSEVCKSDEDRSDVRGGGSQNLLEEKDVRLARSFWHA